MLIILAMECGTASKADNHVADNKEKHKKGSHNSGVLPPHFALEPARLPGESESIALQVVCLIHKKLDSFSSIKYLL